MMNARKQSGGFGVHIKQVPVVELTVGMVLSSPKLFQRKIFTEMETKTFDRCIFEKNLPVVLGKTNKGIETRVSVVMSKIRKKIRKKFREKKEKARRLPDQHRRDKNIRQKVDHRKKKIFDLFFKMKPIQRNQTCCELRKNQKIVSLKKNFLPRWDAFIHSFKIRLGFNYQKKLT